MSYFVRGFASLTITATLFVSLFHFIAPCAHDVQRTAGLARARALDTAVASEANCVCPPSS